MINEKRLQLINTIMIIGTMSAIIFHYAGFAFFGDHTLVTSSFLHRPLNIFCDFNSIYSVYVSTGYGGYFPGILIPLYAIYYFATTDPYLAREILIGCYILFVGAYLCVGFRGVGTMTRIQSIFVWMFLNYAFLFTLHTANLEGVCFLLIAVSVWLRIKGHYVAPSILIGFAASMKIIPAIYMFTILNKTNRVKCVVAFTFGSIAFFIGPFLVMGNIYDSFVQYFHQLQLALDAYHASMVLSVNSMIFGHSLFSALRLLISPFADVSPFISYYYMMVLPVVTYTIFLMIKVPSMYMKTLMATCVFCLFPVTSTDYKLLYFMIPLLLLCHSKRSSIYESWLCVLIALTQIPKGYIHFYLEYLTVNTILNACLMICLLVMCVLKIQLHTKETRARNRIPMVEKQFQLDGAGH